ncbi:MAG: hypothetical protein FWG08_01840 [Propionibacteriaceae bacterium]|nr:hypothetical protein [Propionibacteriaceae bacterium]
MLENHMNEERQQLLDETLAKRSVPGVVTDYVARTLSDEDRAKQLRCHVMFARDMDDARFCLSVPDEGLLMELEAGW